MNRLHLADRRDPRRLVGIDQFPLRGSVTDFAVSVLVGT
jgi:hypothetical protein